MPRALDYAERGFWSMRDAASATELRVGPMLVFARFHPGYLVIGKTLSRKQGLGVRANGLGEKTLLGCVETDV